MTDIEKRAHDFAIAVVASFNKAKTEWNLNMNLKPDFSIDELSDAYLKAYTIMEEKLSSGGIDEMRKGA